MINFEYYIEGSDHYLIPKDMFDELNNWKQENQKYKELIDNIKYYLEDSANQMSEEASYTLMSFLKEVE